jgi:hypothetical protein
MCRQDHASNRSISLGAGDGGRCGESLSGVAPSLRGAEALRGRSEVILGQPEYLFRFEVIDVGPNVSYHLGCDILAMFFDVGNPAMRRVRLPSTVSQQQDRPRRRQYAELSSSYAPEGFPE